MQRGGDGPAAFFYHLKKIIVETRIIRVAEGKRSTLSHLYIGGIFCCYLLEDRIREEKIPGETGIPPGEYGLSLNPGAGMDGEYAKRYPKLHEGMVEIIE